MFSHFVSQDISWFHWSCTDCQRTDGKEKHCNRIRVSCGQQTQHIGGKGIWQDVNREIEMLRAMDHPNIAPRLHWMLRELHSLTFLWAVDVWCSMRSRIYDTLLWITDASDVSRESGQAVRYVWRWPWPGSWNICQGLVNYCFLWPSEKHWFGDLVATFWTAFMKAFYSIKSDSVTYSAEVGIFDFWAMIYTGLQPVNLG